jgi:hypothetical protein
MLSLLILAVAAVPPPVGAVVNGTCGHTDYTPLAKCDTLPRGALRGVTNLAECVARVKKCKQGVYASFSAAHNDCSWYSSCDRWPLLEDPGIYRTEVIKPLPPPPPPPPPSPPTPPPPVAVQIDWTNEVRRVKTAATVEVDVMPFLARQPATDPFIPEHYGGPFEAYYKALSELNASYVRFAPWYVNTNQSSQTKTSNY